MSESPTTGLTADNVLVGHTDEASAYVVDDYPYGYRVRTQIRYWLETTPKHGDRFVSQTLNPKTGHWNKPKKSTYAPVGAMYLTAEGHVTWAGLDYWAKPERVAEFHAVLGDSLSAPQKAQLAGIMGRHKAFEGVTWTVRETNSLSAEERAALDAEDAEARRVLARRVAVETAKAARVIEAGEVAG